MVQLTRIYTRGGDKGKTSLGDGRRVDKHHARIEAFGAIDEANAAIGLARLHTAETPDFDAMLSRIQNDLFDVGADLCVPERHGPAPSPEGASAGVGGGLRIVQAQVDRLESEIDAMNSALAPLNSFVLPGGSPAAAYLHLARTITRRAERGMVRLASKDQVNPLAICYVNRLSDHLFVLSRAVNGNGARDVLWVPGANRA